jgi:hypothetical protein
LTDLEAEAWFQASQRRVIRPCDHLPWSLERTRADIVRGMVGCPLANVVLRDGRWYIDHRSEPPTAEARCMRVIYAAYDRWLSDQLDALEVTR